MLLLYTDLYAPKSVVGIKVNLQETHESDWINKMRTIARARNQNQNNRRQIIKKEGEKNEGDH
jgi:hypothetical protein